ncbi:FHA domain-containing protein, partial [Patescibacteria group bacterium]
MNKRKLRTIAIINLISLLANLFTPFIYAKPIQAAEIAYEPEEPGYTAPTPDDHVPPTPPPTPPPEVNSCEPASGGWDFTGSERCVDGSLHLGLGKQTPNGTVCHSKRIVSDSSNCKGNKLTDSYMKDYNGGIYYWGNRSTGTGVPKGVCTRKDPGCAKNCTKWCAGGTDGGFCGGSLSGGCNALAEEFYGYAGAPCYKQNPPTCSVCGVGAGECSGGQSCVGGSCQWNPTEHYGGDGQCHNSNGTICAGTIPDYNAAEGTVFVPVSSSTCPDGSAKKDGGCWVGLSNPDIEAEIALVADPEKRAALRDALSAYGEQVASQEAEALRRQALLEAATAGGDTGDSCPGEAGSVGHGTTATGPRNSSGVRWRCNDGKWMECPGCQVTYGPNYVIERENVEIGYTHSAGDLDLIHEDREGLLEDSIFCSDPENMYGREEDRCRAHFAAMAQLSTAAQEAISSSVEAQIFIDTQLSGLIEEGLSCPERGSLAYSDYECYSHEQTVSNLTDEQKAMYERALAYAQEQDRINYTLGPLVELGLECADKPRWDEGCRGFWPDYDSLSRDDQRAFDGILSDTQERIEAQESIVHLVEQGVECSRNYSAPGCAEYREERNALSDDQKEALSQTVQTARQNQELYEDLQEYGTACEGVGGSTASSGAPSCIRYEELLTQAEDRFGEDQVDQIKEAIETNYIYSEASWMLTQATQSQEECLASIQGMDAQSARYAGQACTTYRDEYQANLIEQLGEINPDLVIHANALAIASAVASQDVERLAEMCFEKYSSPGRDRERCKDPMGEFADYAINGSSSVQQDCLREQGGTSMARIESLIDSGGCMGQGSYGQFLPQETINSLNTAINLHEEYGDNLLDQYTQGEISYETYTELKEGFEIRQEACGATMPGLNARWDGDKNACVVDDAMGVPGIYDGYTFGIDGVIDPQYNTGQGRPSCPDGYKVEGTSCVVSDSQRLSAGTCNINLIGSTQNSCSDGYRCDESGGIDYYSERNCVVDFESDNIEQQQALAYQNILPSLMNLQQIEFDEDTGEVINCNFENDSNACAQVERYQKWQSGEVDDFEDINGDGRITVDEINVNFAEMQQTYDDMAENGDLLTRFVIYYNDKTNGATMRGNDLLLNGDTWWDRTRGALIQGAAPAADAVKIAAIAIPVFGAGAAIASGGTIAASSTGGLLTRAVTGIGQGLSGGGWAAMAQTAFTLQTGASIYNATVGLDNLGTVCGGEELDGLQCGLAVGGTVLQVGGAFLGAGGGDTLISNLVGNSAIAAAKAGTLGSLEAAKKVASQVANQTSNAFRAANVVTQVAGSGLAYGNMTIQCDDSAEHYSESNCSLAKVNLGLALARTAGSLIPAGSSNRATQVVDTGLNIGTDVIDEAATGWDIMMSCGGGPLANPAQCSQAWTNLMVNTGQLGVGIHTMRTVQADPYTGKLPVLAEADDLMAQFRKPGAPEFIDYVNPVDGQTIKLTIVDAEAMLQGAIYAQGQFEASIDQGINYGRSLIDDGNLTLNEQRLLEVVRGQSLSSLNENIDLRNNVFSVYKEVELDNNMTRLAGSVGKTPTPTEQSYIEAHEAYRNNPTDIDAKQKSVELYGRVSQEQAILAASLTTGVRKTIDRLTNNEESAQFRQAQEEFENSIRTTDVDDIDAHQAAADRFINQTNQIGTSRFGDSWRNPVGGYRTQDTEISGQTTRLADSETTDTDLPSSKPTQPDIEETRVNQTEQETTRTQTTTDDTPVRAPPDDLVLNKDTKIEINGKTLEIGRNSGEQIVIYKLNESTGEYQIRATFDNNPSTKIPGEFLTEGHAIRLTENVNRLDATISSDSMSKLTTGDSPKAIEIKSGSVTPENIQTTRRTAGQWFEDTFLSRFRGDSDKTFTPELTGKNLIAKLQQFESDGLLKIDKNDRRIEVSRSAPPEIKSLINQLNSNIDLMDTHIQRLFGPEAGARFTQITDVVDAVVKGKVVIESGAGSGKSLVQIPLAALVLTDTGAPVSIRAPGGLIDSFKNDFIDQELLDQAGVRVLAYDQDEGFTIRVAGERVDGKNGDTFRSIITEEVEAMLGSGERIIIMTDEKSHNFSFVRGNDTSPEAVMYQKLASQHQLIDEAPITDGGYYRSAGEEVDFIDFAGDLSYDPVKIHDEVQKLPLIENLRKQVIDANNNEQRVAGVIFGEGGRPLNPDFESEIYKQMVLSESDHPAFRDSPLAKAKDMSPDEIKQAMQEFVNSHQTGDLEVLQQRIIAKNTAMEAELFVMSQVRQNDFSVEEGVANLRTKGQDNELKLQSFWQQYAQNTTGVDIIRGQNNSPRGDFDPTKLSVSKNSSTTNAIDIMRQQELQRQEFIKLEQAGVITDASLLAKIGYSATPGDVIDNFKGIGGQVSGTARDIEVARVGQTGENMSDMILHNATRGHVAETLQNTNQVIRIIEDAGVDARNIKSKGEVSWQDLDADQQQVLIRHSQSEVSNNAPRLQTELDSIRGGIQDLPKPELIPETTRILSGKEVTIKGEEVYVEAVRLSENKHALLVEAETARNSGNTKLIEQIESKIQELDAEISRITNGDSDSIEYINNVGKTNVLQAEINEITKPIAIVNENGGISWEDMDAYIDKQFPGRKIIAGTDPDGSFYQRTRNDDGSLGDKVYFTKKNGDPDIDSWRKFIKDSTADSGEELLVIYQLNRETGVSLGVSIKDVVEGNYIPTWKHLTEYSFEGDLVIRASDGDLVNQGVGRNRLLALLVDIDGGRKTYNFETGEGGGDYGQLVNKLIETDPEIARLIESGRPTNDPEVLRLAAEKADQIVETARATTAWEEFASGRDLGLFDLESHRTKATQAKSQDIAWKNFSDLTSAMQRDAVVRARDEHLSTLRSGSREHGKWDKIYQNALTKIDETSQFNANLINKGVDSDIVAFNLIDSGHQQVRALVDRLQVEGAPRSVIDFMKSQWDTDIPTIRDHPDINRFATYDEAEGAWRVRFSDNPTPDTPIYVTKNFVTLFEEFSSFYTKSDMPDVVNRGLDTPPAVYVAKAKPSITRTVQEATRTIINPKRWGPAFNYNVVQPIARAFSNFSNIGRSVIGLGALSQEQIQGGISSNQGIDFLRGLTGSEGERSVRAALSTWLSGRSDFQQLEREYEYAQSGRANEQAIREALENLGIAGATQDDIIAGFKDVNGPFRPIADATTTEKPDKPKESPREDKPTEEKPDSEEKGGEDDVDDQEPPPEEVPPTDDTLPDDGKPPSDQTLQTGRGGTTEDITESEITPDTEETPKETEAPKTEESSQDEVIDSVNPTTQPEPSVRIDLDSNTQHKVPSDRATQDNPITIGRNSANRFVISHPEISRQHADIYKDNQGNWVIRDRGSTNGTLVNGKLIEKLGTQIINSGDTIIIGGQAVIITQTSKGEINLEFSARTTAKIDDSPTTDEKIISQSPNLRGQEFSEAEAAYINYIGQAVDLIKSGQYKEAIEHLSTGQKEAEAVGILVDTGRGQIYAEDTEGMTQVIANNVAYASMYHTNGQITLGWASVVDGELTRNQQHNIAVVYLEEWLHGLQFMLEDRGLDSGALSQIAHDQSISDHETDVALFMNEHGIALPEAFLGRYGRHKVVDHDLNNKLAEETKAPSQQAKDRSEEPITPATTQEEEQEPTISLIEQLRSNVQNLFKTPQQRLADRVLDDFSQAIINQETTAVNRQVQQEFQNTQASPADVQQTIMVESYNRIISRLSSPKVIDYLTNKLREAGISEENITRIVDQLSQNATRIAAQMSNNVISGLSHKTTVQTHTKQVGTETQYTQATRRIIADVHSDLAKLEKILIRQGVISVNSDGSWTLKNKNHDILTFLGDYFDRGIDKATGQPAQFVVRRLGGRSYSPGIEIIRRLVDLKKQGANVEMLLGNHEVQFLWAMLEENNENLWGPGTLFRKNGVSREEIRIANRTSGVRDFLANLDAIGFRSDGSILQHSDTPAYIYYLYPDDHRYGQIPRTPQGGIDHHQVLRDLKEFRARAAREGLSPQDTVNRINGNIKGILRSGNRSEARSLFQNLTRRDGFIYEQVVDEYNAIFNAPRVYFGHSISAAGEHFGGKAVGLDYGLSEAYRGAEEVDVSQTMVGFQVPTTQTYETYSSQFSYQKPREKFVIANAVQIKVDDDDTDEPGGQTGIDLSRLPITRRIQLAGQAFSAFLSLIGNNFVSFFPKAFFFIRDLVYEAIDAFEEQDRIIQEFRTQRSEAGEVDEKNTQQQEELTEDRENTESKTPPLLLAFYNALDLLPFSNIVKSELSAWERIKNDLFEIEQGATWSDFKFAGIKDNKVVINVGIIKKAEEVSQVERDLDEILNNSNEVRVIDKDRKLKIVFVGKSQEILSDPKQKSDLLTLITTGSAIQWTNATFRSKNKQIISKK